MDIFLIYKEDYPWDVRVEKLAKALTEAGYRVTIVARNLDQKPTCDTSGEFQIRRLPRFRSLPALLQKLFNFPLWFNPVWIYTILQSISGASGPVIIVRDLPLVRAATTVARFRKTKVILDMAEVYPEMYKSSAKHTNQSWLEGIIKSSSVAARYENSVLPRIDHTFVMIEESRDRLLAMGVPANSVTIVSNTPPVDKYNSQRHQHTGEILRIVYVGFLTELRGLDLLIEATAHFINKGYAKSSIQVDIVGKGASKKELIDMARKLDLEESVRVHGWLSQNEVGELMEKANVGALTYKVCGHWNHTIPNKIFDYMLAGIPVLATEVLPIQRIIKETNCGVVCRDLDPADIAEKLEYLRDPEVRQALGECGYQAVQEKYNWETDKQRLIGIVSNLHQRITP